MPGATSRLAPTWLCAFRCSRTCRPAACSAAHAPARTQPWRNSQAPHARLPSRAGLNPGCGSATSSVWHAQSQRCNITSMAHTLERAEVCRCIDCSRLLLASRGVWQAAWVQGRVLSCMQPAGLGCRPHSHAWQPARLCAYWSSLLACRPAACSPAHAEASVCA